jgi:hypothetical protein
MIEISQDRVATMADYDQLVAFMQDQGEKAPADENKYDTELEDIRRLGGMNRNK